MRPNLLSGIISYEITDKGDECFLSDFLLIYRLLNFFNPNEKIKIVNIKINKGVGKTYQYYNHKNLPKFNNLQDLINSLDKIGNEDLDFFNLDFYLGEDYYVDIHENTARIYFESQDELQIKNIILKIFIELENLDFDTALDMYELIINDKNKVIKIDTGFNVIRTYKNIKEYWDS